MQVPIGQVGYDPLFKVRRSLIKKTYSKSSEGGINNTGSSHYASQNTGAYSKHTHSHNHSYHASLMRGTYPQHISPLMTRDSLPEEAWITNRQFANPTLNDSSTLKNS